MRLPAKTAYHRASKPSHQHPEAPVAGPEVVTREVGTTAAHHHPQQRQLQWTSADDGRSPQATNHPLQHAPWHPSATTAQTCHLHDPGRGRLHGPRRAHPLGPSPGHPRTWSSSAARGSNDHRLICNTYILWIGLGLFFAIRKKETRQGCAGAVRGGDGRFGWCGDGKQTKPRRLKVRARDRKGANQLSKQGVMKAVRAP